MPDSARPARRALRFVFAVSVLAVLVLSLLPVGPNMPSTGWDKANHLLGFGVLAIFGCWSYPGRIAAVLAGLFAHGALIELLQSFTSYRSGEWGDLLADVLGLVLGWAVVRAGEITAALIRRS